MHLEVLALSVPYMETYVPGQPERVLLSEYVNIDAVVVRLDHARPPVYQGIPALHPGKVLHVNVFHSLYWKVTLINVTGRVPLY